jgi:hypothetical protein
MRKTICFGVTPFTQPLYPRACQRERPHASLERNR